MPLKWSRSIISSDTAWCDCWLSISIFSKVRSEEHTSELQSLMRNSYAVFCFKKKKKKNIKNKKTKKKIKVKYKIIKKLNVLCKLIVSKETSMRKIMYQSQISKNIII